MILYHLSLKLKLLFGLLAELGNKEITDLSVCFHLQYVDYQLSGSIKIVCTFSCFEIVLKFDYYLFRRKEFSQRIRAARQGSAPRVSKCCPVWKV